MDELHSLQLFSKYAFRRDTPLEEYCTLSKEVVSIAAGLPLVLVVLGSTFYHVEEDIDLWEENVRKLREIPNGEVLDKLRFSFEALNREEKEIFLDIACLFIGYNTEICSYMWDDCKYFPKIGIKALINKSLLTIGSENEFEMHDQVRDLGRHIVDEKELGKRSRLWREEEAMDVLQTNQGTISINALCLPEYYYEGNMSQPPPLTGSRFQDLAYLRYLRLGSHDIDGDFTSLLSKLRWLQWEYAGKSKLKNLHMENLVVLNLSHSSFKDNWKGWNQISFGKKLKYLDLSLCEGVIVLDQFSMCTLLESLNLRSNSVCRLDGVGVFKALKYLNASWCRNLETLSELSNMTKLVQLQLSRCSGLSEIQGLEKLESLQDLSIEWCTSLRRLPDLTNLKMLIYLNASHCYSLETLSDLSNMTKLVELQLQGCSKLREIQGLEKLVSLHDLDIGGCTSLRRLPDLSNLKMLKIFDCHNCYKLVEILGLEKLELLETLNFRDCKSLERLSDISKLKNLKRFEADVCPKLFMVDGIHKLNALEHLDLRGSLSLNYVLDISNLNNLTSLTVSGLELQVKGTCLKKLKHVEIHAWDEIQFPCGLEFVESLIIANCNKLIKIEGLDKLQSLITLCIYNCPFLESLSDLPKLGTIKAIVITKCNKLHDIEELGVVDSLEVLRISVCNVLREIPDLRSWKSLKKLTIDDLPKLTGVHGIEELKSLVSLDIKGCWSMNMSNIKEFKRLISSRRGILEGLYYFKNEGNEREYTLSHLENQLIYDLQESESD